MTLLGLAKLRKISLANNCIRQLPRDLEEKWLQANEDSEGTLSVELHGNPLQINDPEEIDPAGDVPGIKVVADISPVAPDGQGPSPGKRRKVP